MSSLPPKKEQDKLVIDELVIEPVFVDTLPEDSHPEFQRFYQYWLERKNGQALPKWSDVELMDLWDLAPLMMVFDKVVFPEGGHSYKFRFIGTEHIDMEGSNPTGKLIDEVFIPETNHQVITVYDETLASGRPNIWRRYVAYENEVAMGRSYDRLLLPLADDSGEPAHLWGMILWLEKNQEQ